LLLTLGRAAEAAADLDALLAEHPEREQARGLLMEALYRQGRHTEALATYQSWRHHLAEELGLEPSPALQRIEGQVLQHTLPARKVPTTPRRHPHRLALPVSSFVGRDGDVSAVSGLLEKARLLTLCGPAGVGKTRLALEVCAVIADRYPDGLHFCDLAAVTRPGDVVRTVVGAVGVEERARHRLDETACSSTWPADGRCSSLTTASTSSARWPPWRSERSSAQGASTCSPPAATGWRSTASTSGPSPR
jgi:hypothetical protein